MSGRIKKIILISVIFINSFAFSVEFPFDDQRHSISNEELEKGFAEKTGIQNTDQLNMNEDKLKWGGFLRQQYNHYQMNFGGINELIQSPSTLGLYFDANFKNGVRGLFRGHCTNDGAISSSLPSEATIIGQSQRTTSELEEMKIQFQIENILFVTLGIQKLKWGTGKFWNPTDFLNLEKRNLLSSEDERKGLNLIKLHVPYDKANFYALANFESANDSKSVGSALRLEYAFSQAEFSISYYTRNQSPALIGFDASFALGDFDFIFETAKSSFENQIPSVNSSVNSSVFGISWDYQYTENNFVNLTIEGVWNDSGVSNKSEYFTLLQNNKYVLFNAAKAYQLISLTIPKPGKWVNSTFQILGLRNQIDQSTYDRITYKWNGIQNLTLSGYYGTRQGSVDTEMKLAGLSDEYGIEASIKF